MAYEDMLRIFGAFFEAGTYLIACLQSVDSHLQAKVGGPVDRLAKRSRSLVQIPCTGL